MEASSDPLKSKSYIIFSVSKVLLFKQYLAPLSQLNSYLTMTKSLGSHHSRRQCCCRRKIGFSSNCLQPHSQTGLYSVLVRLQSDPPFRSWFWLSRTPLHHHPFSPPPPPLPPPSYHWWCIWGCWRIAKIHILNRSPWCVNISLFLTLCITWRAGQLTCFPFGHCATENMRAIRALASRQKRQRRDPVHIVENPVQWISDLPLAPSAPPQSGLWAQKHDAELWLQLHSKYNMPAGMCNFF